MRHSNPKRSGLEPLPKLVAVYGTLKRGEGNYRVTEMCGSKFIGKAKTLHSYCMYGGWGFPRVTQDSPICPIQVEVFEVDNFDAMDSLEGHPNFFERKEIPVTFVSGRKEADVVRAWMYFHPPIPAEGNGGVIVEDGLWQGRQRSTAG